MEKKSCERPARLVATVAFDALDGGRISMVIGKTTAGLTLWIGRDSTSEIQMIIDPATAQTIVDALRQAIDDAAGER